MFGFTDGYLATEKVNGLTAALDVYRTVEGNKTVGFDFKSLKEVDASIHTSQNFLDLYWVLKKSEFLPEDGSESKTFRDFLDKTQYTDTGIFAYEWIFGDNFISPGGAAENLKILKQLGDLKSGQTMLDIGVGIGGGARQAAAEFGLHVLGIDLSSNMLSIALDRLQRDKDTRVRYSITDAMKCEYPPESFDYIFSRDGLHHNDNLGLLIKRLHKCLKPNGRILITVYGKGHGKFSKKFSEYVANRQYHLLNLEELIHIFEEAGFKNVKGVDLTQRFKDILMDELTKAKTHKSDFLKVSKYEGIVNGWMDKLGYIEDDNHCWLQVSADRD
uniref:phosphoethanolamine N-methyltransferase n=1 Tax=Syphacia muris TaxID=451379 RepID=A0A0N5A7P7_9BILA